MSSRKERMIRILEGMDSRIFSHYGLMRRIQIELFCTEKTAKEYVEDMKRYKLLKIKGNNLLIRDEERYRNIKK